jgi:hypothetical protein
VLAFLGEPRASGKENVCGSPWDRFDQENYGMHMKYFPGLTGIQMITIMSPVMARGER